MKVMYLTNREIHVDEPHTAILADIPKKTELYPPNIVYYPSIDELIFSYQPDGAQPHGIIPADAIDTYIKDNTTTSSWQQISKQTPLIPCGGPLCTTLATHLMLMTCGQNHITERTYCQFHQNHYANQIETDNLTCPECQNPITRHLTKTPIEPDWNLTDIAGNCQPIPYRTHNPDTGEDPFGNTYANYQYDSGYQPYVNPVQGPIIDWQPEPKLQPDPSLYIDNLFGKKPSPNTVADIHQALRNIPLTQEQARKKLSLKEKIFGHKNPRNQDKQ
jgi:hypothetical protein